MKSEKKKKLKEIPKLLKNELRERKKKEEKKKMEFLF